MFTNAVSAAVGRMYVPSTGAAEPRLQVQRVEAVARIAPVAAGAASDQSEREHAAQRLALTQGVRSVFESTTSGVEAATKDAGEAKAAAPEAAALAQAQDEVDDPLLEEAILRFIHSVFRSIAEAEGADKTGSDSNQQTKVAAEGYAAKTRQAGFSSSREILGGRIDALARQLSAAGDESDPLLDDGTDHLAAAAKANGAASKTTPGEDASLDELSQSFTDVLRALGGKPDQTGTDTPAAAQPTRGNLVDLMHRLAHAMQGAPPIDEGLPTVGGLLHARA